MAAITFKDYKIDIEVHNIDGIFHRLFNVSFPKGFWVLITINNGAGEKESFPRVDENNKIKTFFTYDEAIEDIGRLLKDHFT